MQLSSYRVWLFSLLLLGACKKESLLTYRTDDHIYFTTADNAQPTDSLRITFSYDLPDRTDSIVTVLVSVTGQPADHDRTYRVSVAGTSTAIEGQHYEPLTGSYALRAGKIRDSFPIRLHRTDDLRTKAVRLDLELVAGEELSTAMQSRPAGSGQISYTRLRLIIDDLVAKPVVWPYFYGKFSPRKFFLLCELGNMEPISFSSTTLYNQYAAMNAAALLERYLAEQKAAGTPVLYEDGTEMKVQD